MNDAVDMIEQALHITPPSLMISEQEFSGSSAVAFVGSNMTCLENSPVDIGSPGRSPRRKNSISLTSQSIEFMDCVSPVHTHGLQSPTSDEFFTPKSSHQGNNNLSFDDEPLVNVTMGPQHFDLLKLIGEGAFGKVILVRNRLSRQLLAMKVISKKLLRKKNNVQYMKSERNILTKMDHPFVVSLYYAFHTEKKVFLVMDFLGGGELFFHLRRRGALTEKEVQFYLAEIVLAIEFLHSKGIIHRDLKPENVLLRSDGNICLTDFGLAKEVTDSENARTLCGTSEYMVTQSLDYFGFKIDLFAGVCR